MKQFYFNFVFASICVLIVFSCSSDDDFDGTKTSEDIRSFEITELMPRTAVNSDTITIIGSNFGSNQDDVSVIINGVQLEIIFLSDTKITAKVLENVTSGPITINVAGKGSVNAGNFTLGNSIGDIQVEQVITIEGKPITFDVILSTSVPGGTVLRTLLTNQYIDNEDYNPNGIEYSIDGGKTWLREDIPIDIRIPEDQKRVKIRIPTIDDNLVEGGETLLIAFKNIGNGDLTITKDETVMLVKDNDSRGFSLRNSAIVQYKVTDDNNLIIRKTLSPLTSLDQKKYLDDKAKHNEIWETVKELIPDEWLDRLISFEIIYNSKGLLGYVYPIKGRLNKWALGLNINYAYASSGKYVNRGWFNFRGLLGGTIVHEFGHIITLNETQINQSVSEGNCHTFYNDIERGCFEEEAYLYGSYRDFWLERDQSYLDLYKKSPREFYSQYKTDFVSRYASTNEAEDIAETIRHFSAQETIDSSTEESIIALQKLNYIKSITLFNDLKDVFRNSAVDIGQFYIENIRARSQVFPNEQKNIFGREGMHQEQSCLSVENNWD